MKTSTPIIYLAYASGNLRNVPREANEILSELSPLHRNNLINVEVKPDVTASAIIKDLQNPELQLRTHVFHYAGHADNQRLIFDFASDPLRAAHSQGLARLFEELTELHLVFLNGCSTHGHLSFFEAAGVPAAIVTSDCIDDAVATNFATNFYRALVSGKSIGDSYRDAETAALLEFGNDHEALYRSFKPEFHANHKPWELWTNPQTPRELDTWRLPSIASPSSTSASRTREKDDWAPAPPIVPPPTKSTITIPLHFGSIANFIAFAAFLLLATLTLAKMATAQSGQQVEIMKADAWMVIPILALVLLAAVIGDPSGSTAPLIGLIMTLNQYLGPPALLILLVLLLLTSDWILRGSPLRKDFPDLLVFMGGLEVGLILSRYSRRLHE